MTDGATVLDAAIRRFPLGDCEITPLTSNENVAAKAMERQTGHSFLLRVHVPTVSGTLGVQHTFEGLQAEMVFREALASGTGLPIQAPVADRAGDYVSSLIDPTGKRPLLCTLLTWTDGFGFTGAEDDAPDLVRGLGATIAAMHRFSAGWRVPQPFIRPVYDNAKYAHLAARLAHGVSAGLFSADVYETIIKVRAKTATLLSEAPRSADLWGIIHADLHTGNLIVSGDRIVPIDFSFCGYGYYLHDLAICLASLKPHLRPHLMNGYRENRPVDEEDMALLDAFFLEGIIGGIAFHIFNDGAREWISRRLPEIAATYCADYLAGRPVALAE